MPFLTKDLIDCFMGQEFDSLSPTVKVTSSVVARGILAISGDRYERTQVYKAEDIRGGFRVTSGWRETGVFRTEKQKKGPDLGTLVVETMFVIGEGYGNNHFDIPFNYFGENTYIFDTFDPKVFKTEAQESHNWL